MFVSSAVRNLVPMPAAMFVQENIEKLKREWTDKYVVVSGERPELRRFDGYTGQVKTVNMSGRALVQFDAWSNIGWYDIELGYLHVVPKPEAGAAQRTVENEKAAAPKKVPAPGAESSAKAAPAKPAGKGSTADILAAARASKSAEAATAKPQAAAAPAAAKPAGGKMSTADILAAARAKKAAEATPTEMPVEEPAAVATAPKPAAKPSGGGTALPKGQRPTVAQMLAFCREHDAKS